MSPRDGLQNQPVLIDTETKLGLVQRLANSGVQSVEVTAFVSPKAVPQMGDAAELLRSVETLLPSLRTSVLVPNLKGLERAQAAGAKEISVVLSATETMNRKNINMGLQEATEVCEQTLKSAVAAGMRTRAYVAVAFDCPFEGETPLDTVIQLSTRMHMAGATEIVIADTIGSASPQMVKHRLAEVISALSAECVAIHLHDTRGMAVANAWAALEVGIRRFDASVGGLGGCPFAPGAAGNLATEDLVLLAQRSGFDTGISLNELLPVVEFLQTQLNRPLGGRSVAWLRQQRNKGLL